MLSVYLFCPLALWPTQWWAVAIQYLPVCIFLFLATWALLHRLQEDSRWSGPLVVLATAAGLLFQERAVLYPVVLGFVAVAFAEAVGLRRIVVALRSHLVVWVPLVALIVGYVMAHRALAPIDSASPGSAAASVELVGNFLARNAVPGFVGGPWADPGASTIVIPTTWAVALGWTVLVVVVALTLYRSRSAVWGWLLLLVYTLADAVLLFGGRTGPDFGEALGLIPRYSADIVPVLVVALGLVARAATSAAPFPEAMPARSPRRWALPTAVALGYLVSAAISTSVVAPHSYNEDDRAYVEGLRADLRADPRVVVFDGTAPRQRHGVVVRRRRPDLDRRRHRAGGPRLRPAELRHADGRPGREAALHQPRRRGRRRAARGPGVRAPRHRRRVHPGAASPSRPEAASRWPGSATTRRRRVSSWSRRAAARRRSRCARTSTWPTSSSTARSTSSSCAWRVRRMRPQDATVCVVGVLVGFPTPG